jgi:hypothetical protein
VVKVKVSGMRIEVMEEMTSCTVVLVMMRYMVLVETIH